MGGANSHRFAIHCMTPEFALFFWGAATTNLAAVEFLAWATRRGAGAGDLLIFGVEPIAGDARARLVARKPVQRLPARCQFSYYIHTQTHTLALSHTHTDTGTHRLRLGEHSDAHRLSHTYTNYTLIGFTRLLQLTHSHTD